MNLIVTDPVSVVLRLVLAVVSLFLLVFGTRVAVTRRFPRPRLLRFGDPETNPRPQPVRIGGTIAFVGASLLMQQTWFLLPVPRPVQGALSLAAVLAILAGTGWFVARRD